MLAHRQRQPAAGGGRRDHLHARAVRQGGRQQRLLAVDALVAGGGDLAGEALQSTSSVSWSARLAAHGAPPVVSIQTSPGRLIRMSVTSCAASQGRAGRDRRRGRLRRSSAPPSRRRSRGRGPRTPAPARPASPRWWSGCRSASAARWRRCCWPARRADDDGGGVVAAVVGRGLRAPAEITDSRIEAPKRRRKWVLVSPSRPPRPSGSAVGRGQFDGDALGRDHPRPDDEGPGLADRDGVLVLADQLRAARDQHRLAVEAAHVAADHRAHEAWQIGVDRGLQDRRDHRALGHHEAQIAQAPRAGGLDAGRARSARRIVPRPRD